MFTQLLQNKKLSVCFILFIALMVYLPIYHLNFQDAWDDQWVVFNEYTENGLTLLNLKHIVFDFYHGQYSPVNQFYYTVLYAIDGYNPLVFHIASLLVHVGNTVLVYLFIYKLMKARGEEEVTSARTSFVTALIFSIHPVVVEPVAWMAASKILLYAFFYLAALIWYIDYMVTRKWKYYLLIAFSFLLSFWSKEQAVVLPVAFFLVDYLIKGKRYAFSKRAILEKVPFLLLALFFGILTILSQKVYGQGLLMEQRGYSLGARLIFACYSVTEYFTKTILPVRIYHLYPFPNKPGEDVPWMFYVYPVALVILAIYLIKNFTVNYIYFGICFFLLHLSTCIHLIPMSRVAIVADRYAYMSVIGIVFPAAYYIVNLKYRQVAIRIVVVYSLFLSAYSFARTADWKNSEVLKRGNNH